MFAIVHDPRRVCGFPHRMPNESPIVLIPLLLLLLLLAEKAAFRVSGLQRPGFQFRYGIINSPDGALVCFHNQEGPRSMRFPA